MSGPPSWTTLPDHTDPEVYRLYVRERARANRLHLRFARARLAADPIRRVVEINEPLNVPDSAPFSRIVPGCWPTVGEIRALLRALEWEEAS